MVIKKSLKLHTYSLQTNKYNDYNESPFYSHALNIKETIKTPAPLKINERLFMTVMWLKDDVTLCNPTRTSQTGILRHLRSFNPRGQNSLF